MILAAAAAACAEVDLEGVEEGEGAIQNGFDDVDTPVANSTVWLADGCTGTLVSPTQVLTASHCRNQRYPSNFPPPETIAAGYVRDGKIVVAATSGLTRRLYEVRINPQAFNALWTIPLGVPSMTGVSAATTWGNAVYVVQQTGTTYVLQRDDGDGIWDRLEWLAGPTAGLAASAADLYMLDRGAVYRRPRDAVDTGWTLYRTPPRTGAVAMTSDYQGNLFVGYGDGLIQAYSTADGWRDVGTLSGVSELASDGHYLLAIAGGNLHLRRAQTWPLVGWSDAGTVSTAVTALAVTRNGRVVHAFGTDGVRRQRALFDTWSSREALPSDFVVVAMASSGSDLFAVDSAGVLHARAAADPAGTWAELVTEPDLAFRAMVAQGGTLYAATNLGLWRRPATRDATTRWTYVSADGEGLDLHEITVAGGQFYGVNGHGRIIRRPITNSFAAWSDAGGDFGDRAILLGTSTALYVVDGKSPWLASAAADGTIEDFTSFDRFEWESTIQATRFKTDIWVKFGNDYRALDNRRIKACYYRHAGETDVMLVELDSPVDPSWAVPADVLYNAPAGGPSFWDTKAFRVAGWGLRIGPNDVNQLVERVGSAWEEIGTVPSNTIALSRAATDVFFAVDRDGGIRRKEAGPSWASFATDTDAVAAVALGRQAFVVRSRDVRWLQENGTTLIRAYAPPLAAGEKLTGGALMGGLLYVSTNAQRLFEINTLTGGMTPLTTSLAITGLAADAGYLYAMSTSGWIYRSSTRGASWSSVGNGDPAIAIAVHAGTIYGAYPGDTRYRQTAIQNDWGYDPAEPHKGAISGTAYIHPGDSGSPAYWTDTISGVRYIMAVGQGGSRYFLTYFTGAKLGNRVMQNISGWLGYYVAGGHDTPHHCPPTLPFPPPGP